MPNALKNPHLKKDLSRYNEITYSSYGENSLVITSH